MRRAALAIAPVTYAAVGLVAAALPACGARSTEMHSTNTGNPPVVDEGKIRVEARGEDVVIRGEAGAVTPGGLTVTVTSSSGVSADTRAAEDGSFSVTLQGEASDAYVIETVHEGATERVKLSGGDTQETANDGGDTGSKDSGSSRDWDDLSLYECLVETGTGPGVGNTDGPQPACAYLNGEALCRAREAEQGIDLNCDSDGDCVFSRVRPQCTDSCGNGAAVNRSTDARFAASQEQIDAAVCEDFDQLGCSYHASGCAPPGPAEPACIDGACTTLTGCALGSHQSARLLAEQVDTLAQGCVVDADCRAEGVSSCAWNCPLDAIFIASSHEAEYADVRQAMQDTCQASGGDCPIPPCTPGQIPTAQCVSGVCVAGPSE